MAADVSGNATASASVAQPASSHIASYSASIQSSSASAASSAHVLERLDHGIGERSLVLFVLFFGQRVGRGVRNEIAQHDHQVLRRDRAWERGGQACKERARTAKLGKRKARRSAATAASRTSKRAMSSMATTRLACVGPSSTTSASRAMRLSSSPTSGTQSSSENRVGHGAIAGARNLDQQIADLRMIDGHERGYAFAALPLPAAHARRAPHQQRNRRTPSTGYCCRPLIRRRGGRPGRGVVWSPDGAPRPR